MVALLSRRPYIQLTVRAAEDLPAAAGASWRRAGRRRRGLVVESAESIFGVRDSMTMEAMMGAREGLL
eukprot:COSAG02_NODE_4117_length_5753_cov_10.988893_1_plen_68_part_00